MKKTLSIFVLAILTIGLISAVNINADVKAGIGNEANAQANANANYNQNDSQIRSQNQIRIQNAIQARNRLHAQANASECPSQCECQGSTTRCELNGSRTLTIRAGNSGNVIIQSKETNASTRVELYKSEEGRIFAQFRNNESKEIILPDEARANARARLHAQARINDITLEEDGTYQIQAQKRARLFWIIPVQERVQAHIDAETGEVIRTRASWWGFMAADVNDSEDSS